MAGNKAGGKKAAQTNMREHGADFYKRIGSIGGKKSNTGGFASKKIGEDGLSGVERARIAGAKGGKISKRGPARKDKETKKKEEKRRKKFFDRFYS